MPFLPLVEQELGLCLLVAPCVLALHLAEEPIQLLIFRPLGILDVLVVNLLAFGRRVRWRGCKRCLSYPSSIRPSIFSPSFPMLG